MKQSDIIMIGIVAAIGTLVAATSLNFILGDPDLKYEKIKTIKAVSSELKEPDPEIFNNEAVNPTIEVYVGSCEDVDQNGILDQAELVACGQATEESNGVSKEKEAEKTDAEEKEKNKKSDTKQVKNTATQADSKEER